MYIKLFLIILFSLIGHSCSQSGNNTQIKVTSSFALSTAGFTGGLIITGESSTGKFIATALNGTSINLQLEPGTWLFRVVGWDGTDPFSGTIFCGSLSQGLIGEKATVQINISNANCVKPEFGSRLRPLRIYSCSALLDSNDAPITQTTSPALVESGFCDENFSVPTSQQQTAEFLRIKIPGGGKFPDIESACLNTSSNPISTYILPLLNVPYVIQLSENSDCSYPITHSFPNGFSGPNRPVTSIVNLAASTYNALFLPFRKTRAPAQIISFQIFNSSGSILAENATVAVGDILRLKITASDPNSRPLMYKFIKSGPTSVTLQDWSSANEIFFTVPAGDEGISNLKIFGAVKNDDGVEYITTMFGDATKIFGYLVPGNYLPASLSTMVVSNSAGSALPTNSILNAGDVVTIEITASDHNGLALDYIFYRDTTPIQNWSSSNTANYTISTADEGISGIKIWGAVRNNDGINFNSSMFGDAAKSWSFLAPGSYSPAVISTMEVQDVNGNILPINSPLVLGQVLTIKINATDPNGLPLSYKFMKSNTSNTATLYDWGIASDFTYTVTQADLGLSEVTILGAVKNNDGKDYLSTFSGDATKSWKFNAN